MASYGSRAVSRQMGWLRHVLTVLSVIIFLLGCIVIGYGMGAGNLCNSQPVSGGFNVLDLCCHNTWV